MKVTSGQIIERLGCDDTQLLRLRSIMGVEGAGSGNRLDYDQRMADVFVSLWAMMQDLGEINGARTRMGLSWSAYSQIGRQLLRSDTASLGVGTVRIEVKATITDWENISPLTGATPRRVSPRMSESPTTGRTATTESRKQ